MTHARRHVPNVNFLYAGHNFFRFSDKIIMRADIRWYGRDENHGGKLVLLFFVAAVVVIIASAVFNLV